MSMFVYQTLLLLAVTYFVGAWLGCLIRRTFFASGIPSSATSIRDAVMPRDEMVPAGASSRTSTPAAPAIAAPVRRADPVSEPTRFDRALEPKPAAPAITPAAPPVAPPVKTPPPAAVTPAPTPAPAIVPVAPTPAATPVAVPVPASPPIAIPVKTVETVAPAKPAELAKPVMPTAPAAAPVATAAIVAATVPAYQPSPAKSDATPIVAPREVVAKAPVPFTPTIAGASSGGAVAAAVAAGIAAVSRGAASEQTAPTVAQVTPVSAVASVDQIVAAAKSTVTVATAIVKPEPAPAPAAATQPSSTTIMPTAGGSASGQTSVAAAMAPGAPVAATPVTTIVAAPAAAPPVVAAVIPKPATGDDDLTKIRTIEPALAARLSSMGINRFADLANLKAADVAKLSVALSAKGRIEQENWIEQAEILSKGGETLYARRSAEGGAVDGRPGDGRDATVVVARPDKASPTAPATSTAAAAPRVEERAAFSASPATPAAAAPASAASPAAPAVAPSALASRDGLQRIAGINDSVERLLNVQGVGRYAQIASWGSDDVTRFDRLLGRDGRIRSENWIEQAQILARGGETAFSREFDRAAVVKAAPRAPADAAPVTGAGGKTTPPPAATSPAPAAAVPVDPPRPARLIDAIREKEPEAAAAAATRSDLSSLRSVRSEAYKTIETVGAAALSATTAAGVAAARTLRPTGSDDLKRIRGIGVLIEKKLNSMGFATYGQVAAWSNDDIAKVSTALDFKGRIERENWVEQARILSSGGQTEFSRRVDRGDVETSKPKPE